MSDTCFKRALTLLARAIGAIYLHRKKALPGIISNLGWVVITVADLIMSVSD
jgi:hypothetical protein